LPAFFLKKCFGSLLGQNLAYIFTNGLVCIFSFATEKPVVETGENSKSANLNFPAILDITKTGSCNWTYSHKTRWRTLRNNSKRRIDFYVQDHFENLQLNTI
jgi:hypothetical protein